eukprot:TRINITY_DN7634_c0_g1_i1.p1 TRINITY_DN7634_c0_g1~~TRINITY_DN7634_c0_g1_i1.p1  ORF type:complete len:586 (-),score=55.68 TRINITY_DN7634_c0_g1_i1:81-1838(-)
MFPLLAALLLGRVLAFDRTLALFSGYNVSWTIDRSQSTIKVKVEAQTTGWVGFGLSENGGMHGADIMIGWVDTGGTPHVKDYWSEGTTTPSEDTCNDWVVVPTECSEVNGVTTIVAVRKLNTGDAQDRALAESSYDTPIIGAYGSSDTLQYHSTNRFSSRINFFSDIGDPLAALRGDSSMIVDLHLVDSYTMPSDPTTYSDFCKDVSSWPESHIVGFEHVISPASMAKHVHHFTYSAYSTTDCSGSNAMIWSWAAGVLPMALPSEAGFRVGGGTGWKSLKMEVHYDNPGGLSGLVDNSGIRTFRTQTLRQHDAAIMQLGDPSVYLRDSALPSGTSKYAMTCAGGYTTALAAGASSVTGFGRLLHMHAVGIKMETRQYSSTGVLKRTTGLDYYNWAFQDVVDKNATWQIAAGDRFEVDCYYSNTGAVKFGLASQEEMCIDFVYYYPYKPSTSVDENNDCRQAGSHSTTNFGGFTMTQLTQSGADAQKNFLTRSFGTAHLGTCPATPSISASPTPAPSSSTPSTPAPSPMLAPSPTKAPSPTPAPSSTPTPAASHAQAGATDHSAPVKCIGHVALALSALQLLLGSK